MNRVIIRYLLLVWLTCPALGEVRNVPSDYPTIQAAIDDSNNGDIVIVAPGNYTGDGNRDIDFKGKAITVHSSDPNDQKVIAATIIDCNGTEVDSHRGFAFVSGEGPDSVLQGLTIINGWVSDQGGAIRCIGSSPTIAECVIKGNSAGKEIGGWLPDGIYCGGGIFSDVNSNPVISNCVIENNSAGRDGGGLFSGESSSLNLVGCTIRGNVAGGGGGGIYCRGGRNVQKGGTIRDCFISSNLAEAGGGIRVSDNSIVMNCIIYNNGAYSDDVELGSGGGIYASNGYPVFINCTIFGNRASGRGGGLGCGYRGTAIMENCIIVGNRAVVYRGDQIAISISNIIAAMNLIIRNCCIQSASNEDIFPFSSGEITIEDTIFDAEPGFVNPQLCDFRLYPDSPCVDAGRLATSVELPGVDIEGNFRITDGNRDGISMPDIGAYEVQAPNEPYILLSHTQLEFVVDAADPNSKKQVLTIQNLGLQTLNWTITEDCDWLHVSSESGSLGENPVDIMVTVDDSNLEPASIYTCNLVVSDKSALNSPKTLPVTLYLTKTLYVSGEFEAIQKAIDTASPHDTIIVGDGIYEDSGDYDINFRGKPVTLRSENGPDNCIIGSRSSIGRSEYASHFIFNNGENNQSVLDGFTIFSSPRKGAVFCDQKSSPTIRNCHFFGDGLSAMGMTILFSDTVIENCIFKECYRAIRCRMSNPKILKCTFQENGLGLYCELSSSPYLSSCEMINNKKAIYTDFAREIRIFDSRIIGNGWDYREPAVECGRTIVELDNCTVRSNFTGLKFDNCKEVTIKNSLISDNGWRNNRAWYGVYAYESKLLIINSTLTGNRSGLWFINEFLDLQVKNAIIRNSIFWGNKLYQISGDEDLCIVDYSIVQGQSSWWPGLGNIDVDPLFVNPGYLDPNGTLNDPNDDFWVDGDYHLESQAGRWDPNSQSWVQDNVTSPCIDAGDPNTPVGLEPFPNGGKINMGAYGGTAEASKSYFGQPVCETIIAGDINGDCKVDFADFQIMASHWLEQR